MTETVLLSISKVQSNSKVNPHRLQHSARIQQQLKVPTSQPSFGITRLSVCTWLESAIPVYTSEAKVT
jgi:hypothetical protein